MKKLREQFFGPGLCEVGGGFGIEPGAGITFAGTWWVLGGGGMGVFDAGKCGAGIEDQGARLHG